MVLLFLLICHTHQKANLERQSMCDLKSVDKRQGEKIGKLKAKRENIRNVLSLAMYVVGKLLSSFSVLMFEAGILIGEVKKGGLIVGHKIVVKNLKKISSERNSNRANLLHLSEPSSDLNSSDCQNEK
ncbi:hypothetical protein H5410_013278 [Solanum commersonii]|uniref:Uncharacterized protein n=1 Tax=Solanum commersonii TaxID=4109 RepID=A0A9J6AUF4_SOLCO|nr:hypothetical protein H5410_013278 [Solanum commersonii]